MRFEMPGRLTHGVVSMCLLLACGCAVFASDLRLERSTVSAMRSAKATPEEWMDWARRLPSPSDWKVSEGGSHFLGGRRCLMTKFFWKVHWGDDWTYCDSTVKCELPAGSYVWVENDWSVVAIDDPTLDRLPADSDAWILIVHGDMLGVVSLKDGYALVVPRPHP